MINEPPVECFDTGRAAGKKGNKRQITIPILGLGSRTPSPPNAPMPGVCSAQEPTPNALESGDRDSAANCRFKY